MTNVVQLSLNYPMKKKGVLRIRSLVNQRRMMLAIEKYKKSEASIEKSARIAGVSISKMVDILREHGIEANLEYEDYLSGLKSLRKVW